MDGVTLSKLLEGDGPVMLVIQAYLTPVGDEARFQPAGFPQVGHVIYRAPSRQPNGSWMDEPVCIVDSAASMANHLETLCLADPHDVALHPDLHGLAHVLCETDDKDIGKAGRDDAGTGTRGRVVTSSLKEGHRLASDYFLDAKFGGRDGQSFREVLRDSFGIKEVVKDKTYWIYPENWWSIFKTIFRYDPNSLVHGVFFAKEQIKISRMLTAHMEAFGAARVGSSGVKFDRLGKTVSGQPIFAVDEETAREIRATFILDLALLRSYGHDGNGLSIDEKRLLLELALWKITALLARPFRFRSNCFLYCERVSVRDEKREYEGELPVVDIRSALETATAGFPRDTVTRVYYPASELFKAPAEAVGAAVPNEQGETDEEQQDRG